MSRSRRKHAIVKDGSVWGRANSHRKLRRAVKRAIQREDDIMPLSKEITNQWDIIDWVYHLYVNEDGNYYTKALRK